MNRTAQTIAVLALLAGAGSAHAGGVVSFSGDLEELVKPPLSVKAGVLESDSTAYFFAERTDFGLGANSFGGDLPFDITVPGNYNSNSVLTPGTVSSQSKLNSYFFHQDPVGMTNRNGLFSDFEIVFEGEILGIAVLGDRTNGASGSTLDDTEVLGAVGTIYPSNGDGVFRGTFDSTSRLDTLQWSYNPKLGQSTLVVGWLANTFGIDQMRVVTGFAENVNRIPGAGGLAVLGMALGLGGRRHREG